VGQGAAGGVAWKQTLDWGSIEHMVRDERVEVYAFEVRAGGETRATAPLVMFYDIARRRARRL
jgi:hypothetical protein